MRICNNAQTVTKLNFGWTGAREYTHEYGHEYGVPESKKKYSLEYTNFFENIVWSLPDLRNILRICPPDQSMAEYMDMFLEYTWIYNIVVDF